jgi:hypothetical protein
MKLNSSAVDKPYVIADGTDLENPRSVVAEGTRVIAGWHRHARECNHCRKVLQNIMGCEPQKPTTDDDDNNPGKGMLSSGFGETYVKYCKPE